MRYLDLSLRLPDAMLHPMQSFIRHEDAVEYEELLTWNVRPDADVEHALFYVEGDLDRYAAAVDAVETVREYKLAPIDERSAHVWACEETRPETEAWRSAFFERELILVPPLTYDADAAMGMTLVGDAGDLQAVLDELPDEIGVTVREVGTFDRRGGSLVGSLTDRQLAAVRTAMSVGYYEIPRRGDLATVADALECAESTASVLLRRAERAVFSGLLDRYGTREV